MKKNIQEIIYLWTIGKTKETPEIKNFLEELEKWNNKMK